MLQDIAVLTGGQVISSDLGIEFKDVTTDMLGRAATVKVDKENTTIINGAGSSEEIKGARRFHQGADRRDQVRLRQGKIAGKTCQARGRRSRHQRRRGHRSGNEEKKLRIDDALAATRAAVEEGYVPGGGSALLAAIPTSRNWSPPWKATKRRARRSSSKRWKEPIRQIAKNAGVDGSVIVDKVISSKKANYGYDALNNKFCDMVESGIIDPTKVTRSVLQNAASVAATLLTTESIVTDIPTPPAPAAPAGGDMGRMY